MGGPYTGNKMTMAAHGSSVGFLTDLQSPPNKPPLALLVLNIGLVGEAKTYHYKYTPRARFAQLAGERHTIFINPDF